MTESLNPERTPEALRARAEMLVGLSEDLVLPLGDGGKPDHELEAAIAQVRAERSSPQLDQVLFELRGPDGQVWTLALDGTCSGFPEGTTVYNQALPLIHAQVGQRLLNVRDAQVLAASSLPSKASIYGAMQAAAVVAPVPAPPGFDGNGNHLYQRDGFARAEGRTVLFHLSHPTLSDEPLAPVIAEALRFYLRLMEAPGFNPPAVQSLALDSGATLSVVALPAGSGLTPDA